VKDLSRTHPKLAAFRADSTRQAAGAALKAAWWGATSLAMRRVAKPGETPPRGFDPQAAPPPSGFVRRAWLEAFEKDNADVAAGLYPPMTPDIATPQFALRQAADLIADTRAVEARRRRHGATEAREDAPGDAFPVYYRQNFHFQTGGWFTPDSARRYEGQVEALFAGAAGAMRRRALSLLAQAWRGRDQRDLTLVDMACGSGAFLANLRTAAIRDGDRYIVNGQKIWISTAHLARWGLFLLRTDPTAIERGEKHEGITAFVLNLKTPGIDVRPLVQITGEAEFNEVFMDSVFVPADQLIGQVNGGWVVANTTLAHERGTNFPFKEQVVHETYLSALYVLAAGNGALDDPAIADGLAQAFVELRLLRLHNWRTLSRLGRGVQPGPESSVTKLAWTTMTQHLSELALDVVGPASPLAGKWGRQWLWSKAASIAGGTSEIQKTIIGERMLGLPRG